jgi:2-amino-4-hydroxy-6-hydroxymethyldihydropteridine diphosphokinase
MATVLLGLGSNLGDREQSLRAALTEIEALPDVRVRRAAEIYRTKPLGGPTGQPEFLNTAATLETKLPPLRLLDEMQDIEARHGRQPTSERWAPRPLDIDLLLYDNEVMETPMLTLPHPRLTFRRFVLEPAAEIAPRMLHPVIGWPVERLLLHLDAATDQLAIVSPSDKYRRHFTELLINGFAANPSAPPTFAAAEQIWPSPITSWLAFSSSTSAIAKAPATKSPLPYAGVAFPKLSILLDADSSSLGVAKSQWTVVARRPGRGPTLRLQETEAVTFEAEITAAVRSVWPDLGS